MKKENQAALILEGGGNRGVFTAGVLDYQMEQNTEFSYVTGVSAGACNAKKENQAALILEGGGNRGVFTAGVLDYQMEQNTEFSYVTGVSAGACNAVDFVSKQTGRTRQCMIQEDKEYSYISMGNVIKNKSLFDMDMLLDR